MESSVILSAYCGKKYLRTQLDSILNQSRVPEEIIVIDDCSPDNGETETIIDEYVARFTNVRKHLNPKNMGWAASFMNGINLATKDVVFFCDQDAIWAKDKIDSMMAIMETENINVRQDAIPLFQICLKMISSQMDSAVVWFIEFYGCFLFRKTCKGMKKALP